MNREIGGDTNGPWDPEAEAAMQSSPVDLRAALTEWQNLAGEYSDVLIRLGHHSRSRHESPQQYDSESGLACTAPSCIAALRAVPAEAEERPKVVCICGSTRFAEEMNFRAEQETLLGRIVVRPEVIAYHAGDDPQLNQPDVKADLDRLHLRKIDLADEVIVVMVDGYIGESTRNEIAYAERTGKPVRYDDHRRPEAEELAFDAGQKRGYLTAQAEAADASGGGEGLDELRALHRPMELTASIHEPKPIWCAHCGSFDSPWPCTVARLLVRLAATPPAPTPASEDGLDALTVTPTFMEAVRYLLQLCNQPGMDDQEWEDAVLSLEAEYRHVVETQR